MSGNLFSTRFSRFSLLYHKDVRTYADQRISGRCIAEWRVKVKNTLKIFLNTNILSKKKFAFFNHFIFSVIRLSELFSIRKYW